MRTARSMIVVGALWALLILPQSAGARGFFGVVPQTASAQSSLDQADFRRMRSAGVRTVRAWLPWSASDPAPPVGGFDFSTFDGLVAAAASERIRVLPFLWGSPEWVVRELDHHPCSTSCVAFAPRHRAALAAWRAFVAAAVERYGRGGTFWAEHPELPRQPVRDWQIWNEQNSRTFFKPRSRPGAYAKVLRSAARAVRGEDRSAEIVLGGMAQLAGSRKAVTGSEYLARLYRIKRIGRSFNSIAVHPYARRAGPATAQVRRFRRVMVAAGDRRASVLVTEGGWSSRRRGHPLAVGPRGQAKRLRQTLGYYHAQRRRLRIEGVFWYSWRDSTNSVCKWCARSGLVTKHGRPKLALRAFRSLAR